ncbi:tyrosyl-DNA phosphodiesterase 1, partial [Perkinsus olseni]
DLSKSVNVRDHIRVAWPLYDVAMWKKGSNFLRFPSKHFEDGQFPLKVLTPLWLPSSRKKYLCHSKTMVSLPNNGWIYMGSHNLSQSAWGRLVSNGAALQISSYELGVFIAQPKDEHHRLTLPFVPPSGQQRCKPWPSGELPWLPGLFCDRVFLTSTPDAEGHELLSRSLLPAHKWASSRGLHVAERPQPLGDCLASLPDSGLLV